VTCTNILCKGEIAFAVECIVTAVLFPFYIQGVPGGIVNILRGKRNKVKCQLDATR